MIADAELRRQVLKDVCLGLPRNEFRHRLTATAEDGTHPIVVALPGDPFTDVRRWVEAFGGTANVVVPDGDGFQVTTVALQD